jgi:hypothetical protein
LLVKEIRVYDRRGIIPTYRIPATVRAIPRKVGGTGLELEPVTPACRDGILVHALSRRLLHFRFFAGPHSIRDPRSRAFAPLFHRLVVAPGSTVRALASTNLRLQEP